RCVVPMPPTSQTPHQNKPPARRRVPHSAAETNQQHKSTYRLQMLDLCCFCCVVQQNTKPAIYRLVAMRVRCYLCSANGPELTGNNMLNNHRVRNSRQRPSWLAVHLLNIA